MQVLPPKGLSQFIKHYLFLESKAKDPVSLRLFADGNTGLVFSFKNKLVTEADNNGEWKQLPGSFLYGQISTFKDVCLLNEADLLIVVFQPSGINQLLGIPAAELRDNIIGIEHLFGKQGLQLSERLSESNTFAARLGLLNMFFTELAEKVTGSHDSVLKAAINNIVVQNGMVSSLQLVKLTGYTERQIERIFIESVGITPKKFACIIKLHYFLKQLKNGPFTQRLTPVAYEAGYADQSHLIKEFKKITGMTPKTYLHKADKLAINFVKMHATALLPHN